MKVGMRKPSLKKSVSARTTTRVNKSMKRAVNPMYGKKGMGWINDPKKAAYNHVYNKTSKSVKDVFSPGSSSASETDINTANKQKTGFLDFIVVLCNLIYSFVIAMFYLVITLGLLAIIVGIFYITFKLIF